ncbi:MAG: hypothetical protein ACFFD1_15230 [Candidatus Thorarchaeota archaeon]
MVQFTIHFILPELIQSHKNQIMEAWKALPQNFINCLGGMDLTITINFSFLNDSTIETIKDVPKWISKNFPADKYEKTFFLLFDFKKATSQHLPIEHSVEGNNFFAMPIWDLNDDMITDNTTINIALLREFFTFLTSFSKDIIIISGTHSEPCVRSYTDPILPEGLRPLERIKRQTEARYKNVPLTLCDSCKSNLCESFLNFLNQTSEVSEQLEKIKLKSDKSTLIEQEEKITTSRTNQILANKEETEEYVPSFVSYSSQLKNQEEIDKKEILTELTSDQKARINRIMIELGIKEPLGNEFYLEIRDRFLKGKISEHAYRQQAKRLAR